MTGKTRFSRTAAERVVQDWYVRQGYWTHRAEASFRRIPTGGACPTCHRRYERTFSASHDLGGIFDGVSVKRGRPRAWWQVTTVSHRDLLGPRGGTRPNFQNVSARKRKIEQAALEFEPDDVLIFGANTVRRTDDARRWRHYFQLWRYDYATADWTLLPWHLEVIEDSAGHLYAVTDAEMALGAPQGAL